MTAVEPVAAFRKAGRDKHGSALAWVDDRLPDLPALRRRRFDLLLVSGVWQHLTEADRRTGLANLSPITAPGGLLILSLRHGPGAPDRPVVPVSAERTITIAEETGFQLVRRRRAESIGAANRAAGVIWTWLAFLR